MRGVNLGQSWVTEHSIFTPLISIIRLASSLDPSLTMVPSKSLGSWKWKTKGLFGFCFHFLCFLFLKFCEENNENKKWKQETGFYCFYYFHYLLNKILKTENSGNENRNQTDPKHFHIFCCLKHQITGKKWFSNASIWCIDAVRKKVLDKENKSNFWTT